jgi:hypothetical protein
VNRDPVRDEEALGAEAREGGSPSGDETPLRRPEYRAGALRRKEPRDSPRDTPSEPHPTSFPRAREHGLMTLQQPTRSTRATAPGEERLRSNGATAASFRGASYPVRRGRFSVLRAAPPQVSFPRGPDQNARRSAGREQSNSVFSPPSPQGLRSATSRRVPSRRRRAGKREGRGRIRAEHSGDGVRVAVEPDGASDDVGSGAECILPETMAQKESAGRVLGEARAEDR